MKSLCKVVQKTETQTDTQTHRNIAMTENITYPDTWVVISEVLKYTWYQKKLPAVSCSDCIGIITTGETAKSYFWILRRKQTYQ